MKRNPKSHSKFRCVAPDAERNIIALLQGKIFEANSQSLRDFAFPADAVVEFSDDGEQPSITVSHGAVEIRVELRHGTPLWKSAGTFLTPGLMRDLDPDAITRITWRFRKAAA